MRIYIYTVKHDGGFSPNPFHGTCTLACCKPQIRKCANVGDWVLGISPKDRDQRLVFAMKISEVLGFAEYFRDRRFIAKRPNAAKDRPRREQCGDNIYRPVGDGEFKQLPSFHSDRENNLEDEENKQHDLGGKNVLVAERFTYFGTNAVLVPSALEFMLPGRFYRSRFDDAQRDAIVAFVRRLPAGIRGRPTDWKHDDGSWKATRRCG